jgi:hypothetical protein
MHNWFGIYGQFVRCRIKGTGLRIWGFGFRIKGDIKGISFTRAFLKVESLRFRV